MAVNIILKIVAASSGRILPFPRFKHILKIFLWKLFEFNSWLLILFLKITDDRLIIEILKIWISRRINTFLVKIGTYIAHPLMPLSRLFKAIYLPNFQNLNFTTVNWLITFLQILPIVFVLGCAMVLWSGDDGCLSLTSHLIFRNTQLLWFSIQTIIIIFTIMVVLIILCIVAWEYFIEEWKAGGCGCGE